MRTQGQLLDILSSLIEGWEGECVEFGCEPSTTLREIHELQTDDGRVILFEIPPAPRGIPIGWQTHHYARNGESLTGLSFAKLDEVRSQSVSED